MEMPSKKVIITAIIILAIITRLIFLDLRPLHHDEGVNYFFADNILEGRGFRYDPLNYHGPSYFYAIFMSFLSFGINEFALRLPAALFGIILVCVPLLLKTRKEFNKYIFSAFILISPSIMYYSRYSIHEILFVLFSFLVVYSFTLIIEKKNLKELPLFAVSLAGMLITKETSVIVFIILFVLLIINLKEIKKINFNDKENIIWSILIFVLIYILFYSSFFSNFSGINDSIRGYMPWTERGFTEPGHIKPFSYYLRLLMEYEWPLVLFSIIGLFYAYYNRNNIFVRNMAIWLVLVFFIYSIIDYKTPWLVVNITLPMALMASVGFDVLRKVRFGWLVIAIGIVYLVFFAFYLNFLNPWQANNRFAYVHTSSNILGLVEELNLKYKIGDKILVASDNYWPLPFYLDGKKVEYLDKAEEISFSPDGDLDYDFYIVKAKVFSNSILPGGYTYKEYSLRDGEALYLVYRG